jgi:hypothetical protein
MIDNTVRCDKMHILFLKLDLPVENNSKENTVNVGNWSVFVNEDSENLVISLTNQDKTKISCVDDLSNGSSEACDEFGERFTTEGIEAAYCKDETIEHEPSSHSLSRLGYSIEVVGDEDNHLNIYVTNDDKNIEFKVTDAQNEDETKLTRTFEVFNMSEELESTEKSEEAYEVVVPIYGYITMDVPASSKEEAEALAMEDCLNIAANLSEMEHGSDSHLELLPYEKILEGNVSYVPVDQISSKLSENDF